ncbi:ethanolamine ammonia-lyase large subunit [Bradyrhizobium sp. JR6.1]
MPYKMTIDGTVHGFADLRDLLAKATPERSGDQLAGIAANGPVERLAAQMALADLPLKTFVGEEVIPSETDEVTRLIMQSHDPAAFAIVSSLTVGELREWLLKPETTQRQLEAVTPGLTPEMVAGGLEDHAAAGPDFSGVQARGGNALPVDDRAQGTAIDPQSAQPSDG